MNGLTTFDLAGSKRIVIGSNKCSIKIEILDRSDKKREVFFKDFKPNDGTWLYPFATRNKEANFTFNTDQSNRFLITLELSGAIEEETERFKKVCQISIDFPPSNYTGQPEKDHYVLPFDIEDVPDMKGVLHILCKEVVYGDYIFQINCDGRKMLDASNIEDILHHMPLITPYTVLDKRVSVQRPLCQYKDHLSRNNLGQDSFTWRVVHCRKPYLSAIEVFDLYNNVLVTAHTIGSNCLPVEDQVSLPSKCITYKPWSERVMLILGLRGDWAILKASWKGFVRKSANNHLTGETGALKTELILLSGDGKLEKCVPVQTSSCGFVFSWSSHFGSGQVDIKSGIIKVSKEEVAENIAVGCSIALLYVLCQARPPIKRNHEGHIIPYAYPNTDGMSLLVAAGLYSAVLPRCYSASTEDGHLRQVLPSSRRNDKINFDYGWDNAIDAANGDVVDLSDREKGFEAGLSDLVDEYWEQYS